MTIGGGNLCLYLDTPRPFRRLFHVESTTHGGGANAASEAPLAVQVTVGFILAEFLLKVIPTKRELCHLLNHVRKPPNKTKIILRQANRTRNGRLSSIFEALLGASMFD